MMGIVNEQMQVSQVTRDGHRCNDEDDDDDNDDYSDDDDAIFGGFSLPVTPNFSQTNGDLLA